MRNYPPYEHTGQFRCLSPWLRVHSDCVSIYQEGTATGSEFGSVQDNQGSFISANPFSIDP
jgi:hypothetical protein